MGASMVWSLLRIHIPLALCVLHTKHSHSTVPSTFLLIVSALSLTSVWAMHTCSWRPMPFRILFIIKVSQSREQST